MRNNFSQNTPAEGSTKCLPALVSALHISSVLWYLAMTSKGQQAKRSSPHTAAYIRRKFLRCSGCPRIASSIQNRCTRFKSAHVVGRPMRIPRQVVLVSPSHVRSCGPVHKSNEDLAQAGISCEDSTPWPMACTRSSGRRSDAEVRSLESRR